MNLDARILVWIRRVLQYCIVLLGFIPFATACTRSTVVVALPSPPARPSGPAALTPAIEQQVPAPSGQLAVAWIERGEILRLRGEAGIASEPQEDLAFDARDLRDLGQATLLGSSPWMQVESPSGIQGWVPAWYLIEQVEPSDFCRDPRIGELLHGLSDAILNQDGAQLEDLVSPRRGLILRHDPWNPEIIITTESVSDLFEDQTAHDWGERYISATQIRGTFRDIYLPKVEDVLSNPGTDRVCLEISQGVTQLQGEWPLEYANVPYYGLYRPAPMGGNPFDWRTLAVGFEYVGGQPYIAVLLLVQPPV